MSCTRALEVLRSRCAAFVLPVRGLATARPELVDLRHLRDNKGAVKWQQIVGRGSGSGRGGTCGRGSHGQKSRSGGAPGRAFEGGQTPLWKRVPKQHIPRDRYKYIGLTLDRLQRWIDLGRLDTSKPITIKEMYDSRLISRVKDGVKLDDRGAAFFKSKVHIEVSEATPLAIEAIEETGGRIVSVYFNKLALRALVRPHKFMVLPRRAEPSHRKDIEKYSDRDLRGYLALGVRPTYPAPTSVFYGGMKEPRFYSWPPMHPVKKHRSSVMAQIQAAERKFQETKANAK